MVHLLAMLRVVGVSQVSRLTLIPKSTLYGYIGKRFAPSAARVKVFSANLRKIRYWYAREQGMNSIMARKYRDFKLTAINTVVSNMNVVVSSIAKYKDVDRESILDAISMSRKSEREINRSLLRVLEEYE